MKDKYRVQFYRERYNMAPEYYEGNKDIYIKATFDSLNGLMRFLADNCRTLEGETYSVWEGNNLLCGGAFDPDDAVWIQFSLGIEPCLGLNFYSYKD